MIHQTEQNGKVDCRWRLGRLLPAWSIMPTAGIGCVTVMVILSTASLGFALEPPSLKTPTLSAKADPPPKPAPAGEVEPPKPVPVGGQTPATPAKDDVSKQFGPGKFRLPYLDKTPIGATPVPTEEEKRRFDRYFGNRVSPSITLDLVEGQPAIYPLKHTPVKIQIVDDAIAEYSLFTEKELSILGKATGTTVMNIWFKDPNDPNKQEILSFLIRVIPDPERRLRLERAYKALEEEINQAFPDSWVCLTLVGDKLMVSGQAKDITEAAQILHIVRANAPGEAATIPVSSIHFDATLWTVDGVTPRSLQDFLLAGGPNVINLLRVPGEQQVMLRVTVAEVDRAAARSIGLNFSLTNNQGVTYFASNTGSIETGGLTGIGAQQNAGGFNNLPTLLDNGQISLAISALSNKNLARTLAEPHLVTINGTPASFQAGGQFPVPVIAGAGGFTGSQLQGVSFVPFGVQLNFTPIITDRDRIRLQVAAEVSTLQLQTQTNIGGANVPGLNTRNFQTTVELREGQTFAIAGLIQNSYKFDSTRVPLLGDLPVVGRIFAFDRSTYGEQELVILVTPELVHPLEPNEVPPLPGSDVFEPGDLEFYLLGRLESRRDYDYRSSVMTDLDRMKRYRHCDQLFIIGPKGHSDGHH